jgi:hypothetical protein
MGDSAHRLGPTLGRLHAYRDRGSVYVEGIRTSAQAGILLGGVAKAADFTGMAWAIALGVGFFIALESAKIAAGAIDYHFKIMHAHQQVVAEANPIVMRQLDALEGMRASMRAEE